jgi:hypothetical protein
MGAVAHQAIPCLILIAPHFSAQQKRRPQFAHCALREERLNTLKHGAL